MGLSKKLSLRQGPVTILPPLLQDLLIWGTCHSAKPSGVGWKWIFYGHPSSRPRTPFKLPPPQGGREALGDYGNEETGSSSFTWSFPP